MLKQVLKLLGVLAVLLALATPASAGGLGVVFDPTPPGGGTNLYYLQTNGLYSVSWQPCAIEPSGPLPVGSDLLTDGAVACLGFANDTGAAIASLNLIFTVSSALNGFTLTCSTPDPYLSNNNCAAYSSGLTTGEVVDLSFTATGPSNEVPANYDFYFGLTGISSSVVPPVEIQVPTYDPGTLVLLIVGIAMLGMAGIRRVA